MIKILITDIAYDNITLSQALTRAKLIAYKIDNKDFKSWIDNELNGYFNNNVIPQYRKIPCELQAVINVPLVGTKTVPIDATSFDKWSDGKFSFYKMNVLQRVSMLEEYTKKANGNIIYENLPQDKVQKFREMTNEFQLIEVHRVMDISQLNQILNQTKQKLIDTLQKLDKEFPNVTNDYTVTKENSEKIQNIITNNIYGNSNPVNIAAGQNVEQNISQNLIDYEKLAKYGVEKQDIDELKNIEKLSDKNTLKSKILKWLSSVSASVAAKGLYDNIPLIMECVKNLIICNAEK